VGGGGGSVAVAPASACLCVELSVSIVLYPFFYTHCAYFFAPYHTQIKVKSRVPIMHNNAALGYSSRGYP